MGCGASQVPDVIIPDPVAGQNCKVLFKQSGFLSRDQYVYQDSDKTKKWLFMDKSGSIFENPKYCLENFVRGSHPSGDKSFGQELCCAKMDVTECRTYGENAHEDSDSSDDEDFDDNTDSRSVVTKCKWAQAVKVKFYKDRAHTQTIAVLKVKAKGKGKSVATRTTTTSTDADGNQSTQESVSVQKEVKCTKLKYTMSEMASWDSSTLPTITMSGKLNGSAKHLKWESPLFTAELDTKLFSSDSVEVKTTCAGFGMLVGYIVAKDISPDDIKGRVNVPVADV